MRIKALVVIVALLLAPALSAQCMGKFKNGIIHVFAQTSGGGGSQWTTDVIITDVGAPKGRAYNDVEIWVWVYSEAGLRSIGKHYSVPAGGTLRVPNVLTDIGAPTSGIFIGHISATYDVVANARIYNTQAVRGDLKPGFGQGLPALDEGKGLKQGEWAQFPVPLDPQEARVNVGVANVSWTDATVMVSLYSNDGIGISSQTITLRPHEVKQVYVNGTVPAGAAPGNVMVTVASASGNAIYPYVSVADNIPTGSGLPTSDPSFFFVTR